ncbi:MAG: MFS transporter, partial [Candidatus Accumulibacter sp.]|nr:MFS transporter [Accumulibacter sp.]
MIQSSDGLPTPARYYAMATVILGIAMTVMDGTLVNLALPRITADLGAGAAQTIWIVNAYQIAILMFLLPCAALGDIVGYRRVYLGGLSLYALGVAACLAGAFAHSLPALVAMRAAQGLGAAGMMAVNTALVRMIYPARLLGRGVAINSMIVAVSAVAGPSVAAGILSAASWPWLFAVDLPFAVIVLAVGRRALPPNPESQPKAALSWLDVALNAVMFACIFLGVDSLGAHGAGPSGPAFVLLAAGLAVGFVYLRRQARLALPVFPIDLLRIPVFALSMCASITAFASQTIAYVALPFLFIDAYGRSPWQAGALITAWPVVIIVVAPVVGRLIGRIPDATLGGIGLALLAAGLGLAALLPERPANADIVWRLALCGIGFGLFQSPNNHT